MFAKNLLIVLALASALFATGAQADCNRPSTDYERQDCAFKADRDFRRGNTETDQRAQEYLQNLKRNAEEEERRRRFDPFERMREETRREREREAAEQAQRRQNAMAEERRRQYARAIGMNEAVAIFIQGQEHYAAGRTEAAANAYRKALALARENGSNPQNQATMTFGLGIALLDLRQYAEAEALFRQVLAVPVRQYKNENDEAVFTLLGQALMGGKKYPAAEALYKQLLTLAEQNPDLNLHYPSSGPAFNAWISAMDNLASAIERQGRYPEAQPFRKRLHEVTQKASDHARHNALNKLNANQEAQEQQAAGQRAVAEYKAINTITERLYLGKYEQALIACDDAMRMAERHQAPDLLTLALEKKAEALIKLNRAGEAETLLKEALAKAEKSSTAKDQAERMRASLAALRDTGKPGK
jgi:tetratricopeptide (TPR) repeat protein